VRKRDFDLSETLAVVAHVFCKHGYEGTSYELLTQATGVAKQSLVNAFGNKKSLLLRAVEHSAQCFKPACHLKEECLTGKEQIWRFFKEAIESSESPDSPGCLVTNLLMEKGLTDLDIAKLTSKKWQNTRLALKESFLKGQKDRSFQKEVDAQMASHVFIMILSGLRVAERAFVSKEEVMTAVEAAIEAFSPKPDGAH
jgi:TetR/AcrR family transcriptional regulator, transcriptional repressor for nem operon